MDMSPICDDDVDHKGMVGRCSICGRLVASNIPDEEEEAIPQVKSLGDAEDLRKILP